MPMTLSVEADSRIEAELKAIGFERIREFFGEGSGPLALDIPGLQWLHAGLSPRAVEFREEGMRSAENRLSRAV